MKVKENKINEQNAINGVKMRFENLALLLNPNFILLEILLDKSVVFTLTFDDSFN